VGTLKVHWRKEEGQGAKLSKLSVNKDRNGKKWAISHYPKQGL
jgi:hypothetical protein